eukprot:gb/GFBE01012469.1/.p1 GENE.gb/GFBE01012469.1/~~gb/GFBE01012469.1/.p1  ORF type:complete len:429 (+),score=124.44 gb/GFBE01012469.1/:1-1287(+)
MASLWNSLRQEVMGTVDDFRQKGALGALRDAALDTRDMVSDAGSWLKDTVKTVVDGDAEQAVLRSAAVPARGATAPLEFTDGRVVEATVLDVDGVSQPPRARVTFEGLEEPMLVRVLAPGEAIGGTAAQGGLLDSLKQEFHETVKDFKEKGAVGALKDAALDAVDIAGSAAGKAASGARSLASDLIDLSGPEEGADGGQEAEGATTGQPRGSVMQLVDGLKQEIKGTYQDIREKGAVATLKDAALDAVDIVGSTASTAVEGAKSVAAPLLEQVGPLPDLWAGAAEQPQEAAAAGVAATAAAGAAAGAAAAASSSSSSSSSSAPAAKTAAAAPAAASPAPAASPSSAAAASSPASSAAAASPSGGGYKAATPAPKAPAAPASPAEAAGDQPDGKPAKKSIVSMRRNMFEKSKDEPKEEPKKDEEEEVID